MLHSIAKSEVILRPPEPGSGGSWFGVRVDFQGRLLVVGAWHASGDGVRKSGRAYVYHIDASGQPVLSQVLVASDQHHGASFGTVALAGDGSTIAVGSYGHSGAKGCIYMFLKDESEVFKEMQRIGPAEMGLELGDGLGLSVCMDTTATWVLAGAPQFGKQCGVAYIFKRGDDKVWKYHTKVQLEEDDANSGKVEFGEFVAMEQQASYCAIAAPKCGGGRGIVYIMNNNEGQWELGQRITPPGVPPGNKEYFGTSIAADGNRLFISSPGHDRKTGCVYVLEKREGLFEVVDTIQMPDSLRQPGQLFGVSLSCSVTGDCLFVSATGHSFLSQEGEASHVGSVALFQHIRGEWIYLTQIQNTDKYKDTDEYGLSISASEAGDAVAVGAWKSGEGDAAEEGSVSFVTLSAKRQS